MGPVRHSALSGCERAIRGIDRLPEVGGAIRPGSQLGDIFHTGQDDRQGCGTKRTRDPISRLSPSSVAIEGEVDPVESSECLNGSRPNVRAKERQGGHSPLLERQPIERPLYEADDSFQTRTIPSQDSSRTRETQVPGGMVVVNRASDKPDRSVTPNLGDHDATGHGLITAATDQSRPERRPDRDAAPTKVGR